MAGISSTRKMAWTWPASRNVLSQPTRYSTTRPRVKMDKAMPNAQPDAARCRILRQRWDWSAAAAPYQFCKNTAVTLARNWPGWRCHARKPSTQRMNEAGAGRP